ncbi:hypothetical protein CK507_08405 [Pseudomonas sp. WN033]|nr:hypothetical protein CK507_08405 [Pseudomonas sp. WN033]
MLTPPANTQRGFSLIEIMIGLLIALLLLGGLLAFFISYNRNNLDLARAIRLEQDIRSTLNFMARDIRRAGYWNQAHIQVGSSSYCSQGFFTNCTTLEKRFHTLNASGSGVPCPAPPSTPSTNPGNTLCYSYNSDPNDMSSSLDDFGFTLRNGTIFYMINGVEHQLTDPNATAYTSLSFNWTEPTVDVLDSDDELLARLTLRELEIIASAIPTGETAEFARTVTKKVRIRNDEFALD